MLGLPEQTRGVERQDRWRREIYLQSSVNESRIAVFKVLLLKVGLNAEPGPP